MIDEQWRRAKILAKLDPADGGSGGAKRLCEVSAEVTKMTGASIMLMSNSDCVGSVCASNDVSALIEELQYVLGEGPCVDAFQEDRPIVEPNLTAPSEVRWSAFTPAAVEAGAKAVFGFPLRVSTARLGALSVYRDTLGPLTEDQHADALVMAEIVAEALLAMQSHAAPGEVASEIEDDGNLRLVVHQASGMLSVQADVTVEDALVRLRAYAFSRNRLLTDVAENVVNRSLRFDVAEGGKSQSD